MAVGKRLRLEQEHQLDDGRAHFFAGAAGVRHHEVVLQLRQVFGRDGHIIERAEAGGDAIDRPVDVLHFGVEVVAALFDGRDGLFREGEMLAVVEDLLQPLQGQVFVRYGMHIIIRI